MKVIDLLNKIAKGEEVPKKIIIDNTIFERTESFDITQMYNFWDGGYNHFWLTTYTLLLDEEVEIIEEEKDIEILDIGENAMNRTERYIRKEDNKLISLSVADYKLATKINEIIRAVNELKKDHNE